MRIKKVSQVAGLVGGVSNTYNESTNDAYSCDYINDLNTYSTSEVNTGQTWIDGKPIYRTSKIIDNISTYNSFVSSGLTISNIDNVISIKNTFRRNLGTSNYVWYEAGNLTETQVNQNYITSIRIASGDVQYLVNASSYSVDKIIVTIEYTKTTD